MVLFSHVSVSAGVTDLKLSTAQIFDVQWNISGGKLNTSGFNYIFSSINYATQTTQAARWTQAQTQDAGANGRYISFFHSTTNPGTYGMAVYNSDGSIYKLINNTGSFRTLADGAIFYNGNGMWGTLITTKQGFNYGQSASFTLTQEYPTNQQLEAYVPDSTTPLAAGETAAASSPPPPPPPPTPVYRSSAITQQQATRRSSNLADTAGHNAGVSITGDGNDVYILQAGSGGHYASVSIQGNSNNVDVNQTSTIGARHYLEAAIIGSSNIVDATQSDTAKTQFVSVNGNNNSITTSQTGTGNHFLDLSITGDDHTAGITQRGSGNHEARVALDGSQPWNFGLTQDGSTSQRYTLPHDMSDGSVVSGTCSTIGGCNLIINQ
jgi:hypothetical protein